MEKCANCDVELDYFNCTQIPNLCDECNDFFKDIEKKDEKGEGA